MKMSLLRKLILVTSLLMSAAISILFYTAHHTGHRLLEEVGNAKAVAVIQIGMADVEHMMLIKKEDKIRHALKNIETTGEAASIAVLRTDGTVFFSSDMTENMRLYDLRGFKPMPRQPNIHFRRYKRNDSTFQVVIAPFMNKQECFSCHGSREKRIGYMIATVPLQDLQTIASVHRESNIYLIVFTFSGLAISIFLVMYFLVARPARRLDRSMKTVIEGIPELRTGKMIPPLPNPVINKKDEIGELARSFKHLIDQLNTAYQELLQTHHNELARADQLSTTGEMAASIAHEIKNPVAGLSAALQVFQRNFPESDSRLAIVAEMLDQVTRINGAVNDLLSYAQPAKPHFTRLDLTSLIKRTIVLLQPLAGQYSISFTESHASESSELYADEKLLQQLLWNILINAVQSMSEGGIISISHHIVDKQVHLEIADQGKGIPEHELHLIFKPFFTTKHKGTGLGMSISKSIVEQHGGSMSIRSTLNQGTIVLIILPIGGKPNEG